MSYRNPRSPFVGSGTEQQGGFLAVHKQDFNSHVSGTGFQHHASDVLMQPILPAPFNGADVQTVISQLVNNTSTGTTVDSSYVSIGSDGYSIGEFNVSGSVTFADALEAAFASSRLRNGGTILIRAGYYLLTRTVTIPKGINLLGEAGGVFINRVTNGTSAFIIQESTNNKIFNTQIDTAVTSFKNINFLSNIYNQLNAQLFDDYIIVSNGTIFEISDCSFIGTDSTARLISVYYSGAYLANMLTIRNCYIDNFGSLLNFYGVTSQRNTSFCTISNCRIRYNADSNCIYIENSGAFIDNNKFIDVRANGSSATPPIMLTNSFNDGTQQEGSDISTKLIITNNIGYTTADTSGISFVQLSTPTNPNDGSYVFLGNIGYNNYWNNQYNSTSYSVIIGDGLESFGDITGTLALNFLLPLLSNRDIDVLVQPGTYQVHTSNIDVRFGRIIGTSDVKRPVIIFNTGVSSTIRLPCHIENVVLYSFINNGGSIKTINIGRDESDFLYTLTSIVTIKNSVFINCQFNIRMEGSSAGSTRDKKLIIENNFIYRQNYICRYLFKINDEFSNISISNNKITGYGNFIQLFISDEDGNYLEGVTSVEFCQTYNINNNIVRTIPLTTAINGDSYLRRFAEIIINNLDNALFNFEGNIIYDQGSSYYNFAPSNTVADGCEFIYIDCNNINYRNNSIESKIQNLISDNIDGYFVVAAVRLHFTTQNENGRYSTNINVRDSSFHSDFPLLITIEESESNCNRSVYVDNCTFIGNGSCLLITDLNESLVIQAANKNKCIRVTNCNFLSNDHLFSIDTDNRMPSTSGLAATIRKPTHAVHLKGLNYKIDFNNNIIHHYQITPTRSLPENNLGDFLTASSLYISSYKTSLDDSGYPNGSSLINVHSNNICAYSCVKSNVFTMPPSSVCLAVEYKNANICDNYLYWTSYPSHGGAASTIPDAVMGWLYCYEYVQEPNNAINTLKNTATLFIKNNIFDTNGDTDTIGSWWSVPYNMAFFGNIISPLKSYKTFGIFNDNIMCQDSTISPKIYHYRDFYNWIFNYKLGRDNETNTRG
jgi:hypothetical protein